MNLTIESPNKRELNNDDVLTCRSTGEPAPSMRWTVMDGQTPFWDLGDGPQLTISVSCACTDSGYKVLTTLHRSLFVARPKELATQRMLMST